MAQFLQNFADKLPHLAQRMLRGNAPFRVDIREHPALIEKSSTHRKSSRRISGKSESPPLHSGEVFPQTASSLAFFRIPSGAAPAQRMSIAELASVHPNCLNSRRNT